jgi:YebC/PmpR family DNA-binding regulatory protein
MSGHNRWSKIKHKKAASDAGRSKVWSKIIKEITVASRMGGGNPHDNPRLRTAVDKARSANMPNDTIDRAIKKGTGDLEGVSYEEIVYEAYGPAGVAMIIEVLTDNRTRVVAEVRNILQKYGGNLGASGSVAYLFKKKGTIFVEKTAGLGEDKLMELALEAGAEDVREAGEGWEIESDPAAYLGVKEALEKAKVAIAASEIAMIPSTRVALDEEKARSLIKLIAAIEDNDDVQNVFANHEIDDAIMEKISA